MSFQQFVIQPTLTLGDFSLFGADSFRLLASTLKRRGLFLRQCNFIGVTSITIVAVAAIFLGGVLGYQLFVSLHLFGAEALLGGSVGVSLFRELGPVMASIMVTGRAGAAMAAEISTMRITEQVDALEVMAVDPIEYLVVPRIVAAVLMMPILGVFFCVVASISAALISCSVMGLSYSTYWNQYTFVVDAIDIVHCIVKCAVFGLMFSWIGCFNGFNAHGGAQSVGVATRNTVVASCLSILLSDYVLTSVLPFGHGFLIM